METFQLPPQELNEKLAQALKTIPEFKQPEWSQYVKTSSGKERTPDDPDFWYKRAASIIKEINKRGIVGTNRLRVKYGCKKNRGYKPERFRKASGKIIRTILQQTDAAGFTSIAEDIKGVRSKKPGRQMTVKGKEFLENIKC